MDKVIQLSNEDKLPTYTLRVEMDDFGRMISSLTIEDLKEIKEKIDLVLTDIKE